MPHPQIQPYSSEYLDDICKLIEKDLSEPYSKYVYRYFLHQWPQYSYIALLDGRLIGAIVSKQDARKNRIRGYIAMLAVDKNYRGHGIATQLANASIQAMRENSADEIVLETEVDNEAAKSFYEHLGFSRYKRLYRYYLNGRDAFRYIFLPEKALSISANK
ncbi:NatC N-acetyltransferase complex catalytic subunit [Schizosaccharomyces japonicus yFS275]|uniref:NatC N-acetyltransferase complex catalytic subunit n=1 Tax=Schizosaccharomyces japonicus (strain yFS275 / FY16936) TaxID=402676 RepID=B6K606_SCHJY|nr:NatC N-acetyltransferase complex catalytic subunit [Schizosaccharomyces japonicus yFS275]EEB08960.1 NatC N-acetyltransferase complex catalytic subunit [Schizosaccharomyces japonicus yFS275]